MDAFNPYDHLGIAEDAPFEEVTAVRDRLLKEAAGDPIELERIEAAYDAILRDRLRARIEGKITVPDRIRFAEKSLSDVVGQTNRSESIPSPSWLSNIYAPPDRNSALTSLLVFGGLGILGLLSPKSISLALAVGLIAFFYLQYRKENKFGRSLLWIAGAMFLGTILGFSLTQLAAGNLNLNLMAGILFCFWLVTTFFR
ncbi:MAG: molecular chaperone DnaJ [Cyanobacteria bacterium M5B4]|nr:MAG: molecular chaperone DnaJ [Cyanobacteria bacterium M5B4]